MAYYTTYPASPIPQFSYVLSAGYKTLISNFDSGVEQRRRLIRFPKRSASLNYKHLSTTDRTILQNFFTARFGSYSEFWFVDPALRAWVDEYIGRGMEEALEGAFADDGGVQVDETDETNDVTADDMTLLPAVPVVNDAYYFGSLSRFDTLRLNIGIAGDWVGTIVWEYWNGTAWTACASVTDGTSAFEAVAGEHDVNFDLPTDWALCDVGEAGYEIEAYWIRARVATYTSLATQPKGTQAWVCLREYDLHTKTTVAGYKIYADGVLKTGGGTDYTFVSGGGGASSDRVKFVAPLADGVLITSDIEGYLRIKARFAEDSFGESVETRDTSGMLYNIQIKLQEIQW